MEKSQLKNNCIIGYNNMGCGNTYQYQSVPVVVVVSHYHVGNANSYKHQS
jgi:hypothetical protein